MIEPATHCSHVLDGTLGYRLFENAYVVPYYAWGKSVGGVMDNNGNDVYDSEYSEWKTDWQYYQEEAKTVHKKAIYLGFLIRVFGHSFTDNLKKLWFLNTKECKYLIKNGWELVFTSSENRDLPDYVYSFCKLAGFDISSARAITSITRFDQICVPDSSFIAGNCGRKYHAEYRKAIENILNKVPLGGNTPSKIYFSRTKCQGSNKEFGEYAIEQEFKKGGYTVIYPEEHSIEEQIQMVRNCNCLAATEGSVSHLSIFCKPETNVVLINKARYMNFHQVMINEFSDLNVTYIEAHHSIKANSQRPWWGPFYLCVNKHFERFWGHRIVHLPYWLKYSYWEYSHNILYKCLKKIRKTILWKHSTH